jgi:hypothetical protein
VQNISKSTLTQIYFRYQKPTKRPEPPAYNEGHVTVYPVSARVTEVEKMDLLWKMSRMKKGDEQHVAAWAGFNSYLSKNEIPVAMIRYLPFLRAPPSDMSTIYTVLFHLLAVAEKLGQTHVMVTADMAIYSKAQEILWTKPAALDNKVTMRLGGMHLTMSFIASIGKIYADGGLLTVFTESGVYAQASAHQMLEGKQLSRGVRAIKLMNEALFRLLYSAMEVWMEQQGKQLLSLRGEKILEDLQLAFATGRTQTAHSLIDEFEREHLQHIVDRIEEFTRVGRNYSATFAYYWSTFMAGADVLLHLLRAERDADFILHLSAVSECLPWFRAAGRHNYAKYVPTYLADMKRLEETHPTSYHHLLSGGFVVRHSANTNFNCVATDTVLEQTINREGKSHGGVIGLTLRKGALNRWLMTRHVTAEYAQSFKSIFDFNQNRQHAELGKSRIARDEADVIRIMETITQNENPFDLQTVPPDLINIVSGQVATSDVADSLATFLTSGNARHDNFCKTRLVDKTVSFWAVDPRVNFQLFNFCRHASFANLKETCKAHA